ncbi:MAG: ThiF family adenylyltransferase [Burkholderiaceae bacterium]|jgi:tRNA A37 threonylcarbamoyladenosine dehydratase
MDATRRFGGIDRLYPVASGDSSALDRLQAARVAVVGLGGVGSWLAEALARSGVGALTLIDMDHVAESNINRQIHALDTTLGQSKVQAMAERIAAYAPACRVQVLDDFLTPDNLSALLGDSRWSAVSDCCDQVNTKAALAAWARQTAVPVVLAGAAGGKTRPARLRMADLAEVTMDPLLAKVRYRLRRTYDFPRTGLCRVPAVYSDEPLRRAANGESGGGLNCAGYGSAVTVTATMGLHMAAWIIEQVLTRH